MIPIFDLVKSKICMYPMNITEQRPKSNAFGAATWKIFQSSWVHTLYLKFQPAVLLKLAEELVSFLHPDVGGALAGLAQLLHQLVGRQVRRHAHRPILQVNVDFLDLIAQFAQDSLHGTGTSAAGHLHLEFVHCHPAAAVTSGVRRLLVDLR